MKQYGKFYIFEDDDEFYKFAIVPRMFIKENKETQTAYSYIKLTDEYNTAVKDGKYFYISDPDSKVKKRSTVEVGVHTVPVEHIEDLDPEEEERIMNKRKKLKK